jgi:HlyD family secretion protein
MKKLIIRAAILIIILAIIIVILVNHSAKEKEASGILLSGNVEITEVTLGFTIPGRIVQMSAEEGQKIIKGERLSSLDSTEIESIIEQNRAFLNEAIARTDELRAGARTQEVEQAKANLNSAEAELVKAQKDFTRAEILHKNGAFSDQQMDAARKGYDIALAQHLKAVEALSLVKEGTRRETITAAENRAKQAAAAIRTSEEKLKNTILFSPITGVVLRKNAEAGEAVAAGMPVYIIGDIENVWIKVYIKETQLGLVKLGQKAEVTVDSFPDRKYEGIVTNISSEAEFTPKTIQTREERVKLVFGVKVSLKNTNQELKSGMPADVRILLK